MKGACPHCGLRECDHDRTTHQGPFVEIEAHHNEAPAPSERLSCRSDALGELRPYQAVTAGETAPIESGKSVPSQDVNFRPDIGQQGSTGQLQGRTAGPSTGSGDGGRDRALSSYDEPVEPPPTVVPITPKAGAERVLQAIERRTKRKPSTQGSLF